MAKNNFNTPEQAIPKAETPEASGPGKNYIYRIIYNTRFVNVTFKERRDIADLEKEYESKTEKLNRVIFVAEADR